MIKGFVANNLVLNFDKTNIMKFTIKNSSHSTLHIGYKEKYEYIKETENTKFLDIEIDSHLTWKNHTEQMISKLSAACYPLRRWSMSVTLTLSNQYTTHISILLQNME
jgi:hypothetical protein